MKKIYKFEIKPNSVYNYHQPIVINAPQGAKPIHVEGDFLWAEVETDNEVVEQEVLICIGTGHGVIPEGYTHFQSITQTKSSLTIGDIIELDHYVEDKIKYVWHFYKKTQDDNELSKMGLLSDYDKYTGKLR